MKVLTAKSRTAILIFLSVFTLAIVSGQFFIIHRAPSRIAQHQIFSSAAPVPTAINLALPVALVLAISLSSQNRLAAFRPWTAIAQPRAPPV